MKKCLLTFLFFLSCHAAIAQDFEFGKHSPQELSFQAKEIDSNSNAVVLKEFGKTQVRLDERSGKPILFFEYHVKIKIFNKEGYRHANVVIPAYKDDQNEETVKIVKASTFQLDNRVIREIPMDKKAIFKENRSKYQFLTKFTLPDIRDGSIIEYVYTLESPLLFNFKNWDFQSEIPKVSSEYEVQIPPIYNYNVTLRGFLKLSDQKSSVLSNCLQIQGLDIDCSKISYIMRNIPAFVAEDHMTSPKNFMSAIYFQLSDIQQLDGRKINVTKNWKDVDFELTNHKLFGDQVKRKDLFKNITPEVTRNLTTDLEKAKALYGFIKNQLKWNRYLGKYSDDGIKSALEKKSGNVGDINLALVAALSSANLDAEAVILSTRDNGLLNTLHPVLSDFDYVIAKVTIGNESYLLDATEPLLPFGMLPLRCINDKGRAVPLKKPSYWVELKAGRKTTVNHSFKGKLSTNGKLEGELLIISHGYAALNKRMEIKNHNSTEEYVEKLDEKNIQLNFLHSDIQHLDSIDNPLVEKYTVALQLVEEELGDSFRFNPFFINRISKNPYNLSQRSYPVDLGSESDGRIAIQIELPTDYSLADQPRDVSIALPNSGGKFLSQTQLNGRQLTVNQQIQFSKSIYDAYEYPALKAFYSQLIQNQRQDVLFTKEK